MSSYTLDDIKAAAEAKYGSTDIETPDGVTRLLNPLRLKKDKRDALSNLQDALDGEDSDQEAALADVVRTIAETPAQAESLLKMVGDDLAYLAVIINFYMEGTQAGEA